MRGERFEAIFAGIAKCRRGAGGVAQLAEKAKLNRESLYKTLSERGNQESRSLEALLHALGFRLALAANR